jgi:ribonuclease HII
MGTKPPSRNAERHCWDLGEDVVVGIDEVGRGAWAGPLTLGAVVLPHDGRVNKIRDSKMLTAAQRELLFDRITDWAVAWSVGHATQDECDKLGMSEAQRIAAVRAIDALGVTPSRVLVDGNWNFVRGYPTTTIVKGDRTCLAIAAASILAKVTRDAMMAEASIHHPEYGFDRNKGYPAPEHIAALAGYGPCRIHRTSWAFMDSIPWTATKRYDRSAELQPALF